MVSTMKTTAAYFLYRKKRYAPTMTGISLLANVLTENNNLVPGEKFTIVYSNGKRLRRAVTAMVTGNPQNELLNK